MPTQHPIFRHRIGGGWGPDFGSTAELNMDADPISLPWLTRAENILYTLDGGARKIGGLAKLNSSELESGATVTGLVDYWRHGSAGSPSQKRVIHVGTKIKKDDADGVFTDIFTGMVSGANPSYAIFDDYLIMMNDSSADVPKYWDQTTAKDLGTNTPNGAFGVTHKNRFWLSGEDANPSRLYYSQALPSGADSDWSGGDAGFIDVDPGDGDRITGLASYKDSLWVFKGPYKGSIHRITGSSPSDFARIVFVRGLGAVGHNSIFQFSDDLGFMWSDGSIRSLKATAAFGDFNEAALSLPLNQWLRDHVRHDRLSRAWAATLPPLGCVFFTIPVDTSVDNNLILCMDYRFIASEGLPRWSSAPAFELQCIANVSDAVVSGQPALFSGSDDGFVRKMHRATRTIDVTGAYLGKVTTPFVHYQNPVLSKTVGHVTLGMVPQGAFPITFGWRRDDEMQQSFVAGQVSGDVLAPAPANQFTLGTSMLGESAFTSRFLNIEDGGEFRSIQYDFEQGDVGGDFELHTWGVEVLPCSLNWEN